MLKIKFVLPAFIIFSAFFLELQGQGITSSDRRNLNKRQDSLQRFADSMINGSSPEVRFRADSNFVRGLVRALQTKNSFFYPFESLVTISKLYAPDSAFRIFTWQLKRDEYVFLQKGAIQVRTPAGLLKLFPLFDNSMFTAKPQDSVRKRDNWIGAIYYRIVMKEHNGKKYYTLLGFDDFSVSSNKKWMDILTFDDVGEPVFGGAFISFKNDSIKKPLQARFNIEYKKEARTLFNYDPEMDMIVFDHLVSETDEPNKKSTFIPDGDFEGFKWQDGQWVHVDKIFDFKLQDGEFPTENKLRDDQGNIDEKKLEEASIKNIEKTDSKPPVKKKVPPKEDRW